MSVTGACATARRIIWLAALVCLATLSRSQESPPPKPAPKTATEQTPANPPPSPEQQQSEALDQAFRSAAGNPQLLIKNLEDFLARFPQSPRRAEVLRAIFSQALQANDPQKATTYAERLLDLNPADAQLLSALVDLLDRKADPSSLDRVIQYATRFIERAEKLTSESRPADVPEERWEETQALMRAAGYLMRGKVYAKRGDREKAFTDYEKSYAAYPMPQAAERLGDLAAEKGDSSRAIDYYATAFAYPEQNADPAHRGQLRKKLGSAYLAQHRSENGLGDLILTRYDELTRALSSRHKGKSNLNSEVRDPYDFVLLRPDGSEFRLRQYQSKVLVLDFWATWCLPCRLEERLLERVRETFRSEPAAVFLAVNVDEDREGVPGFIQEEKWTVPVAYAQGLDQLLRVSALPTLVIFDRQNRVVFRQEGLDPRAFVETLERKVRESLGPSNPPSTAAASPK